MGFFIPFLLGCNSLKEKGRLWRFSVFSNGRENRRESKSKVKYIILLRYSKEINNNLDKLYKWFLFFTLYFNLIFNFLIILIWYLIFYCHVLSKKIWYFKQNKFLKKNYHINKQMYCQYFYLKKKKKKKKKTAPLSCQCFWKNPQLNLF